MANALMFVIDLFRLRSVERALWVRAYRKAEK